MMNRQLRKRFTLLLTKVDSNDTHTDSLVCLFLGIVLACLSPLALLGQAVSASPSPSTISPGAHQPSLNLLVSARGARISGVIQNKDGKPVGGALVVLGIVANDGKPALENATVSDQKGEFRFQGLAPGKYQISTRLRSKMTANSSVTRTRVALSEGEQKDVTLKLE